MGHLWEMYEQLENAHVDAEQGRAEMAMASRIAWLEQTVVRQNEVLGALIHQLEIRFGEDLDGDGRIG
jgi:hypothetical protein